MEVENKPVWENQWNLAHLAQGYIDAVDWLLWPHYTSFPPSQKMWSVV